MQIPTTLPVSLNALADMAVEVWRLRAWCSTRDDAETIAVRHATGRLERWLSSHGVESIDMTGQPYEAGLSVQVVDTIHSETPTGPPHVAEMVAPLILWNGHVIRDGLVVTCCAPAPKIDPEGGSVE